MTRTLHAARLALLLCLAAWCLPSVRADAPPTEPGNLLVNAGFARDDAGWGVPDSDIAFSTYVPVQVGPYRRAVHVAVSPGPNSHPWDAALRQDVQTPLKKGDPLLLKVWMRSPQSLPVGAYVEQNGGAYAKIVQGSLTLTPQWKEYQVRGAADADYPTGGAEVVFHLSNGKGAIEITGVRLFNLNAPPSLALGSGATPDRPVSLIGDGDFSAPLAGVWNPVGPRTLRAAIVDARVGAYTRALQLTTLAASPDTPWTIQIGQPVAHTVGSDDAIYARAWMRSPTRSHVTVAYEQAREPNAKSLSQTARLTPDWKEYRFLGSAAQRFGPGESQFKFFVGQDKGVVEIAGVRVETYGEAPASMFQPTVDYYGGAPPSDAWRAAALARIEKIRKGDLRVVVTDARGRPVRDATVKVTMTRHAFRWGTAAPAVRLVDTKNPNDVRFQREVKRLFNTVVLESDLKWITADGNPADVATAEKAIAWLRANGIQVRGHNLVWGSWKFSPPWLKDMTPTDETQAVETHVRDFAKRFAGKVYVWDVVNEAVPEKDLWEKIGWENFANVYKWAHQEDPHALLAYNDYQALAAPDAPNAAQERQRIQFLIDHGAPLDVIGEQAHLGTPLLPIGTVLERLDALAKFGKRIEITELDLGVPDDTVQGQYLRDFYTAAFSHPAVDGVIQWGFWEGSHWRAKEGAALFRRDWTPRPAATVYEHLVLKQWWTRAQGKTGATGAYETRGFLGDYAITVTAGGKTRTIQTKLSKGGALLKIALP